ncbi:MAG: GtrA family protein [Propionibacteriaceae bacterium]|jgi:putative flippase GtrA|nr:GtrA family protein [Propionibacteriaceae bacterium]
MRRTIAQKLALLTNLEFFRYAVVGGVSFLCDYGVLRLTVGVFGFHYLWGAFCGFCVGLSVNFLLAERFVFGSPKVAAKAVRFGGYALIGVGGLGLLELMMWVQVDGFGWDYRVAKVVATGVGYLWNYLARRLMYARRAAAADVPVGEAAMAEAATTGLGGVENTEKE